jgi:hypothetical protein
MVNLQIREAALANGREIRSKGPEMFGITPLGWLHTLGSLPAIPAAAYMIFRFGRIEPNSLAGRIYFICMLIGSLTIFLVAKAPRQSGHCGRYPAVSDRRLHRASAEYSGPSAKVS